MPLATDPEIGVITRDQDQLLATSIEMNDVEQRLVADIGDASPSFARTMGRPVHAENVSPAGGATPYARADLTGDFLSNVRAEILTRVPDKIGEGIRAAERVVENGAAKLDASAGTGRALTPATLSLLAAGLTGTGFVLWRRRKQSMRRRKPKRGRQAASAEASEAHAVEPDFEATLADPFGTAHVGPTALRRRVFL
jgi:hypothetical protein